MAASCAAPSTEEPKLKLALIPVLDTIPDLHRPAERLLRRTGHPGGDPSGEEPQERDVFIQTGQADGVLTDLQGVGLLNKDAVKVKAVYTSRRPFPDAPLFRILASPKTSIQARPT